MAKKTVGLIPERKDITTLGKFYEKISKDIKATIMSLIIDGYSELRAMKVRREVDRLVNRLNVFISGWTRNASKDAYKEALKVNKIRMDILGLKPNPKFDNIIHRKTIEFYRDDTFDVFVRANNSILENTNALIAMTQAAAIGLSQFQAFDMRDERVISELLDEELIAGATRQTAKKAVISHFAKIIGDGNFININGRNYNIKKYAKMVGRTRLRKLQSEAAINMAKQYDADLVEVSDHGTETEICKEFEGNVYSLTGNTPGYEVLPEPPPFHPNCMHSIFATSLEALGIRERFE